MELSHIKWHGICIWASLSGHGIIPYEVAWNLHLGCHRVGMGLSHMKWYEICIWVSQSGHGIIPYEVTWNMHLGCHQVLQIACTFILTVELCGVTMVVFVVIEYRQICFYFAYS